MEFVIGLFTKSPYLLPIIHLAGWLGWVLLAGAILFGIRLWWEEPSVILKRRWWLALLLVFILPFTATFGLRIPGQTLPLPGVPATAGEPLLLFFAALPWVLAGGFLGPLPAVVIGAISGLLMGLYTTNSLFAPLEIAGLALLFSWAVRQRYRTMFYRVLRHPLGAAVILALTFAPAYMLTMLLAVNGPLAVRLDFALTQTWEIILLRGFELFLAGLVGEVFYLTLPLWWGCRGPLLPSPAETRLQTRIFQGSVPLVLLLVLALTLGDWLVAGNAARRMVEERLSSTARLAIDSLPFFVDMGQSLAISMATPDLLQVPLEGSDSLLAAKMRSVPYFRQLSVYDSTMTMIGGYPESDSNQLPVSPDELQGVDLALSGVLSQIYVVPAYDGERSAQIAFIAAIPAEDGSIVGALIGRTDLETNPFAQPVIEALKGLGDINGQGFLVDENQTILYPVEAVETGTFENLPTQNDLFYEHTLPDGTRSYAYYYRAEGRPWAIVMAVPAQYTQQVALNIAIPLLAILSIVSVLAFVLLRLSLGSVSRSVQLLAHQASLIMRGDLNQPVRVEGEDEIGQLASSFEQMRVSLKSRLDELNHLLVVSQGIAANFDIQDALQPILKASILDGACLVRIVLTNEVMLDPRVPDPVAFAQGNAAQHYAHLDQILYDVMRHQDSMILPNIARMRRLNVPTGKPVPGALMALPVRHNDRYFGAFWIAYDVSHTFSDAEVRFLSTLAGQIALAAYSSRLYAQAEVGRQRLEAVLASTPEPVLVFDEDLRLLLLNHAALQLSDLIKSANEGQSVAEVVEPEDLANWLMGPLDKRITTRDITLPNGRIYYTSVSSVSAEGRGVGRICIMRDITHFKELDQLKSEFVATVSHDLRSPLTLMRGYAGMLQMVGELNDQQKNYTTKIIGGVETMSRLVNNLLDLGRIEAGIGLQIEKVVLQQVIDEVVNSLQAQATQKEIHLSQMMNGEGPLPIIEADRALVQQAMYNLVENAIKYTPVGGQVNLTLEVKAATVLLRVIDSGIGIAPLDLPRLFEKFYRSGRREAHQQRGSGLGLAIVKSIAERHKGRVWVDSQLGKGSVFSLELPIRASFTSG